MNISDLKEHWQQERSPRGEPWKYRELSGEHLGVRLEELSPGATSSEHHYHTSEEEHVVMLQGEATLVLGENRYPLRQGQHVWFAAGDEIPHHLVNTTVEPCQYLVFGERKKDDVVVYPGHEVMMIKALDFRQVTYRPLKRT